MRAIRIMIFAMLFTLPFYSCMTSKKVPGPETEKAPTGDMGGGTGSGTIGDDPSNP